MTFSLDRAGGRARTRLHRAAVVLSAILGLLAAAGPAAAQRLSPRGQSDVIVDYSVLDELGPAPTLPQLLLPRQSGFNEPPPGAVTSPVLRGARGATSGPVHLKPPKKTTRRTAKRTTKTRSKAPAKAKAKAKQTRTQTASRSPAKPATPPSPAAAPPPPPPPLAAPSPAAPAAAEPPAPPPAASARSTAETMPPPPPSAAAPSAPPPPPPVSAGMPAPPAKRPAPAQTASLPPAPSEPATADTVRIAFDAGSARISADGTGALKKVAQTMAADDKLRIQLLAYAGGTDETASQARRLSLSRALAARSYLIGEGVRSTRIDVRALGNKSEGGPADRIDVVVTRR